MPVFFYIDREFATDPNMKDVNTLTLSYTFFKVNEEDEAAAEAEGRSERPSEPARIEGTPP